MAIVNVSKPASPSFANTARVSDSEFWNTMTSIWSAELRTWQETISTMDSVTRPTASITNTAKPS